MNSPDEPDRTQHPTQSSHKSPSVRYIERINTRVYGDEGVRNVLWALNSLANSVGIHVTKKRVAEKADIDLQTLHNLSALKILGRFGIVELIQKAHRNNEVYIIIDDCLCGWLETAGRFGPNEPPDENEFPDVHTKVRLYGEYLEEQVNSKSEPTDKTTSTEKNFELLALDLDIDPPITTNVTIQSEKMNPDGSTTRWRLELEGKITGDLNGVAKDEVINRIEKEMIARIRAALLNHRVACWCESLTDHLIKVTAGKADCNDADCCHIDVRPGERLIEFQMVITKIKSDRDD